MRIRRTPLRVGLVGAGPWAYEAHAPMLAAGPETELTGVWTRRPERAEALADRFSTTAFARYEDLVAHCDAVAFAVPPPVQADLAIIAAEAGRALLLEKPLAGDVAAARRVARAVDEAGVASVVGLTFRFTPTVRAFLGRARELTVAGARACFLTGSLLPGNRFATEWRLQRGAVLDLGPHVFDLLEAACGRVESVDAHGSPHGWVTVVMRHADGVVSEAALSATVPLRENRTEIEVYGAEGWAQADFARGAADEAFGVLRREFVAAAHDGGGHPLDAEHGLHLQEIIEEVEDRLAADHSTPSASLRTDGDD